MKGKVVKVEGPSPRWTVTVFPGLISRDQGTPHKAVGHDGLPCSSFWIAIISREQPMAAHNASSPILL
jgi:hypothetical protein